VRHSERGEMAGVWDGMVVRVGGGMGREAWAWSGGEGPGLGQGV